MTTYTGIPNGDIDRDSAITQTLMTLLRDNPIAQTEGAPGAPRTQLPALEEPTAGTTIRSRNDGPQINTTSSYTTVLAFGFMQRGTVRVTAEHRRSAGGTSSYLEVSRLREGVLTQLQEWNNGLNTFVARSLDVTIRPGDELQIRHRCSSNTEQTITANARIQTGGEYLWPAGAWRMEAI